MSLLSFRYILPLSNFLCCLMQRNLGRQSECIHLVYLGITCVIYRADLEMSCLISTLAYLSSVSLSFFPSLLLMHAVQHGGVHSSNSKNPSLLLFLFCLNSSSRQCISVTCSSVGRRSLLYSRCIYQTKR
jgi:hypothetical protein